MPTSHETATNAAYCGQEAFTWPQKIWEVKLHKAEELVDKTRHFYHHALMSQFELMKDWLDIIMWSERKVAHIAHDVIKEATPERAFHDGVKDVASKKS